MPDHLIVIRAGATDYDLQERIRGTLDMPLSMEGVAAATRAGERLAADPLFQGVDIVAAMRADDLAGRAAQQVADFVAEAVEVALATCPARGPESALKV